MVSITSSSISNNCNKIKRKTNTVETRVLVESRVETATRLQTLDKLLHKSKI